MWDHVPAGKTEIRTSVCIRNLFFIREQVRDGSLVYVARFVEGTHVARPDCNRRPSPEYFNQDSVVPFIFDIQLLVEYWYPFWPLEEVCGNRKIVFRYRTSFIDNGWWVVHNKH